MLGNGNYNWIFKKSIISLLLNRTSVSRHRVLSLWWPGGLPAQEQAHLFAVLPGQEPRWWQSNLRGEYPPQPEERVRTIRKLLKKCPIKSMRVRSWVLMELRPPPLHLSLFSYVSFGSESDGGYMDMSKDEPAVYVPMQEQTDTIKYADIQPSPYESPYQQDLYQEQGSVHL